MLNTIENNTVYVAGTLLEQPKPTHSVLNEVFYECKLKVPRLSKLYDEVPVTISEKLLPTGLKVGDRLACKGQFRSHNALENDKSKLLLTLFVRELLPYNEEENPNKITLIGYICKPPVYRTTPFNREICDMLVAVNRIYGSKNYNRSDYIPCISWGRDARFASKLSVGEKIKLEGRIQSREYKKIDETGLPISKIAYEISVTSIERDKMYVLDDKDIDMQQTSIGQLPNYYKRSMK